MNLDWLKTPNKQRGIVLMVVGAIGMLLSSLLFARGCQEYKLLKDAVCVSPAK